MPQVIQKLIPQSLAQMSPRYQSGYIEQLNGHAPLTLVTRAVVGFAAILETKSGTCTGDLQVPYRSLWVDGSESCVIQQTY